MDIRGPWLETQSGKHFHILDPTPQDISILDIAHGLSLICRFGGHTRKFYSVAEHSVRGAMRLREKNQAIHAMHFLMHDASEAYLVDIPRPIKQLMPNYQEMENKICKVIADKWGLTFPWPEYVKDCDNRMLITEQRDLLPEGRPYADAVPFYDMSLLVPWSPESAKNRFLELFHELHKEIQQ